MPENALELLLKLVLTFSFISAVILSVTECENIFAPVGGGKGIRRSIIDCIKILSKGGIDNSYDYIYIFVAVFISSLVIMLPFSVYPVSSPLQLGDEIINLELFTVSTGIFLVLLSHLIGYSIIFLLKCEDKGYLDRIFVIRDFMTSISPKVAIVFVIMPILILYDSPRFHDIVLSQSSDTPNTVFSYGFFMQPLAAILFLICIKMESGIGEFSTSERLRSDSVLSYKDNIKIVLIMALKNMQWISSIMLFVYLFLGGYSIIPTLEYFEDLFPYAHNILQVISFMLKVILTISLISITKWLSPKWRISSVMEVLVNRVVPLAIANVVVTVGYLYHIGEAL